MDGLSFDWDPRKDSANQRKHGVSFEEACTVFVDEAAGLIADPDHSQREDRFLLIGLSTRGRVLVVCHTYRGNEIRLIAARRASRHEHRQYWRFRS